MQFELHGQHHKIRFYHYTQQDGDKTHRFTDCIIATGSELVWTGTYQWNTPGVKRIRRRWHYVNNSYALARKRALGLAIQQLYPAIKRDEATRKQRQEFWERCFAARAKQLKNTYLTQYWRGLLRGGLTQPIGVAIDARIGKYLN